jgi:hypothetical protein
MHLLVGDLKVGIEGVMVPHRLDRRAADAGQQLRYLMILIGI